MLVIVNCCGSVVLLADRSPPASGLMNPGTTTSKAIVGISLLQIAFKQKGEWVIFIRKYVVLILIP